MAAKSRAKDNANPLYSSAARLSNAIQQYGPNSPEADAARLDLATVRIEEVIKRLVDQSPPLPEANRRRLAALFDSVAV